MPEEKLAQLTELYNGLKKEYGEDSVKWGSEIPKYDVVSSGSLSVDFATGVGGFPTNRVVEINGENSAGKTTLALHATNNFLEAYPHRGAVFLDCEHRLTTDWAAAFVKDMGRLLILWPDTIEQATQMYRDAVGGNEEKKIPPGLTSIAVLDSIGGAPTQRVTGKSSEKNNMGGNSLGVTAFSNFATTFSGKYNCCTIGINQVRDDMDGWHRIITPGGNGWKHACSLRVNLKPGDQKFYDKINGENVQVGYSVVAKVIKNSLAPPHRLGWYIFYNVQSQYGFGVDTAEEVVRLSTLVGVVEKRTSWFYHPAFPGEKVNGNAKMMDLLAANPEIKQRIIEETLDKLSSDGSFVESFNPDAPDAGVVEPRLGLELTT